MLKLRPMCATQCQTFATVISQCFGDAVERGITISEFAAIYDSYNCSDPSTHLPSISDLYDSQEQCYNFTLGKFVASNLDSGNYESNTLVYNIMCAYI